MTSAMQQLSLPAGPLKIVCLAAHPDDIEIAAGATLLALAERGAVEGHWLTLTGSPERRAEAEAAARAFLLGFPVELPRIPRWTAPSALERGQGHPPCLRCCDTRRRCGSCAENRRRSSRSPAVGHDGANGLARCSRPPLRDSEVGRGSRAIQLLRARSLRS